MAALALFLGVSLTLGSVSGALGRWAPEQDPKEWWREDFQQTPAFRRAVEDYLESFLTLGAGGELRWYVTADSVSASSGWAFEAFDSSFAAETPMAATAAAPEEGQDSAPDAYYKEQKNILYRIVVDGETKYASADWQSGLLTDLASVPEGFNFALRFSGGKVSIRKDGEDLDVYGNGVYDDENAWRVPGYENFPAGEDVENVEVLFAIRQTPIRFMQADYRWGSYTSADTVYTLYAQHQQSRAAWRQLAVTLAAGLALLGLAIALRRYRAQAEQALSRLTPYVFTEARGLAIALSIGWMAVVLVGSVIENSWQLFYRYASVSTMQRAIIFARCVGAALGRTWALLIAVWSLRLVRIDHRYHEKSERRSLVRLLTGAVRRAELRYPLQRRLWRQSLCQAVLPAALVLAAGLGSLLLYFIDYDFSVWHLVLWAATLLVCVGLELWWLRRGRALARDFGRLADQVQAVQRGELDAALTLPEESDLRESAERLRDIQAGLRAAVQEQMKSERMKVELVSNVSHDLKTPLTSVLSYSELLLQEPLEGAARDYAVIIAQKAQRLKAMVQDVFDISKAASDQLPLQPQRLDLAKLLRQTLADMNDAIEKSGLQLRTQLPEEAVYITADGKRLYRVFQNLLQNALQYSLPGSRVYLTLTRDAHSAETTLRNTSCSELPAGVDFTARFVRGDESRTDGGSGLGLSIAKSFTEACGGSFRVQTVADLFTASVRFPLCSGPEEE